MSLREICRRVLSVVPALRDSAEVDRLIDPDTIAFEERFEPSRPESGAAAALRNPVSSKSGCPSSSGFLVCEVATPNRRGRLIREVLLDRGANDLPAIPEGACKVDGPEVPEGSSRTN